MDGKFIEKLLEQRKQAIGEYLINNSYELLKKIDTYTSILAMSKVESQLESTSELTEQMKRQVEQIDLSKVDINELIKQMG